MSWKADALVAFVLPFFLCVSYSLSLLHRGGVSLQGTALGDLRKGQKVLVLGGSSSTGFLAVQVRFFYSPTHSPSIFALRSEKTRKNPEEATK